MMVFVINSITNGVKITSNSHYGVTKGIPKAENI